MKKIATLTVFASLGLAACGSAEDASTEARPDTVEMPADEALAPIAAEPVAPLPGTQQVASSTALSTPNSLASASSGMSPR